MRYAGFHSETRNGREFAVAAIGAHPNAAAHMTATQKAKYGPYQELSVFPMTVKGKKDCMAFCDSYNIEHFPADFGSK